MAINTDVNKPVIDPQAAPVLGPEPVEPTDLEARVAARRDGLLAKLDATKSDARLEVVELRDRLKAKLAELEHIVKEGVVDGWANINETTKGKLDHWLAADPNTSVIVKPVM